MSYLPRAGLHVGTVRSTFQDSTGTGPEQALEMYSNYKMHCYHLSMVVSIPLEDG